jgi:proteasome lid subunit RPN8/RPN11
MERAFEVYFQKMAFDKAVSHFEDHSSKGLEALGLLVGSVFSFEGKNYAVVEDYVTSDNEATAVSVRFSPLAFSEIARQLKKENGWVVVGWAHSHPGFGCFLSSTDVRTQQVFFPEEFHVALVCDPLKKACMVFKVKEGEAEEASFAVVKRR